MLHSSFCFLLESYLDEITLSGCKGGWYKGTAIIFYPYSRISSCWLSVVKFRYLGLQKLSLPMTTHWKFFLISTNFTNNHASQSLWPKTKHTHKHIHLLVKHMVLGTWKQESCYVIHFAKGECLGCVRYVNVKCVHECCVSVASRSQML